MAKKFYYFDIKGLGESSRYLLHYGGIEFEDVRFSHDPDSDWPKQKEILSPPFGKLPLYKDGDRTIHQSMVINRYIGRQLGLVPTDPWEEAVVDSVIHTLNDFFGSIKDYYKEQDEVKKADMKKAIIDEQVPFFFSRFDKQLQENNGSFGKKLSWADISFVALLETFNEWMGTEIQSNYSNIKTLFNKVHNLKGIKAYIEKRKK